MYMHIIYIYIYIVIATINYIAVLRIRGRLLAVGLDVSAPESCQQY